MRIRGIVVQAGLVVLIGLVGALSSTVGALAQAKPNFSGTWTMVPDKSSFGQMPTPSAMTRTITHTEPTLKIVTFQTIPGQPDTNIQTVYTTDGKPAQNTVSGNPMTTIGKWEGSTLVLNSTMSYQGTDITIEDRYSLSDAGKTLTVTRKIATPGGATDITVVMTKK